VSKLETELEGRDVFLVVLTPDAWGSKWVRREFELALHRSKRILGVKHKPVELTGFITTLQLLDAAGQDAHGVAQQISATLGITPSIVPRAAPPGLVVPTPPPLPMRVPGSVLRTDGVYVALRVGEGENENTYHFLRFYSNGHGEDAVLFSKLLWGAAFATLVAKWSALDAVGREHFNFTISDSFLMFTLGTRGKDGKQYSGLQYAGTITPGGVALELAARAPRSLPEHRTYRFLPVDFTD
jgi:hypothetical protein